MAKLSIEWHENCLKNHAKTVEQYRITVEREIRRLEAAESDLKFHAEQIEEAKRRGLSAFDPDKFMRKKAAKGEKA